MAYSAVENRRQSTGVMVGKVQVGGGAPIVVQSMSNTDSADAPSTARQCLELAEAGSELVRITVNNEAAARVMHTLDIPTNDLFELSKPRLRTIQLPANVHFTPEGSQALAQEVARAVLARLE